MEDTADYVITFEELAALFEAKGIDVHEAAETSRTAAVWARALHRAAA